MADISIAQVTTTNTEEGGVFDVLMRSIDAHLDKQYSSGRIKGSDYATVYLGALQTVLQQAIAFVLAEQKLEKELEALDKQIELITQQVLTEAEQTRLVGKNADKVSYEITNILPKQASLLGQQLLTEVQQTRLVDGNADKIDYEVVTLLPAQKLILDQQRLTEVQQTRLVDANADAKEFEVSNLLPEQEDLLQSQDLEVKASTVRQDKVATEQISASQAATALKERLGLKQESVYQKQAEAFDKDAKYKVANSLLNVRVTGLTQDIAGIKNGTGTDSGNALVNEMLQSVGFNSRNILDDVS